MAPATHTSLVGPPCGIEFFDELVRVHLRFALRGEAINGRVTHHAILKYEPAIAPRALGVALYSDDEG